MSRTTKALPVQLTGDDVIERADRLAWVIAEIQEAGDDLKKAKDKHKEIVEGLTMKQGQLAERIRRRTNPQLELDLKMTSEQVVDVADQLVGAMLAITEADVELMKAKNAHKKRNEELTHEKLQLASEIRNREAMRQVEVEWRPNHEAGIVECWRMDTGELVEQRAMDGHEADLDFDSVGLAAVP